MRIRRKKLMDFLNCSDITLETYLCRTEFSHIKREQKRNIIFSNINKEDVLKLQKLVNRKRTRMSKNEISLTQNHYDAVVKQNRDLQKENQKIKEVLREIQDFCFYQNDNKIAKAILEICDEATN